ncbi:calcineurin-like phosphoesterase [Diplocarpon rosae]|nr:calcineurin-like phosphoesterase [Diplocarpon rosae]
MSQRQGVFLHVEFKATTLEHDIVLLKHRNNPSAPIVTGKLRAGRKTSISTSSSWKDSVENDDIIGRALREIVLSKRGVSYRILEPTLAEYTDATPRLVTPIYSQDASLIVSLLDLHPPSPRPDAASEDRLEIFEAGTGHGALTLQLARAIHAGNTPAPDGDVQSEEASYLYEQWRSARKAVIHTLDVNVAHSKHAEQVVRNFRNGMYFPHIDFHTGTIEEFLENRLEQSSNEPFLHHAILDLPATHDYIEIVGRAMKPNGTLLVFCPSITQINTCVLQAKQLDLPFFLERVIEIGGAIGTGGKEWDVRLVKPRAMLKNESNEAPDASRDSVEVTAGEKRNPEMLSSGEEMICRPKVGVRVSGGGGRQLISGCKMTRRIVRTACQLGVLGILTVVVIFILDNRFRVLPSAIHNALPAHHPGSVITDITVTSCSRLNLFTSCKLDSGIWHRIEKDLYLGKGWFSSAFVHVKRKKEEELLPEDKVIIDVTVGRLDPSTGVKGEGDTRWESRPTGLWLKRSAKRHASDSPEAITAVDVLFGADAVDPRDGWQMVGTALLLDTSGEGHEARLSIRRGKEAIQSRSVPRIGENGKFKILQVADLHLSTGTGHCRDEMPVGHNGGKCEADPRTLEFVGRLLDEEKPDLVVLSGDQINGETAPDAQSAIFKYAELFVKRQIPYATIFGNHDDEGSLPRSEQMTLIESLPYSLSIAGPEGIDGVGNYVVEVLAQGGSKHSALTIYLLDTHAYSPDERNFKGYDWLKKNQIDWFKDTAQGLKKKHAGYTHIHMNLAFIHIPLPEYRDATLPRVGEWREGVTAPGFNSGFRDALVEEGVVMLSCGHDHANEYCSLTSNESKNPAMWMCYAGGAGFGGYGGYGGYHRRVRFFDIDMNEARIRTWKRLEYGETGKRIDEQIIVEGGRARALESP